MMKLLVVLGLLGVTSLFADYQLTLIDKDGNQTNECVKSYSFSNNLESIARAKSALKDVYSEEETLTNKIYLGKPVYRKIIIKDWGYGDKTVKLGIDDFDNIWVEQFFSVHDDGVVEPESYYHTGAIENFLRIWTKEKFIKFYARDKTNAKTIAVIEYTKTADKADKSSGTFRSFLHYTPSSSTISELVSVDLKETGVRILEDYTYDSSTNSCTKN